MEIVWVIILKIWINVSSLYIFLIINNPSFWLRLNKCKFFYNNHRTFPKKIFICKKYKRGNFTVTIEILKILVFWSPNSYILFNQLLRYFWKCSGDDKLMNWIIFELSTNILRNFFREIMENNFKVKLYLIMNTNFLLGNFRYLASIIIGWIAFQRWINNFVMNNEVGSWKKISTYQCSILFN